MCCEENPPFDYWRFSSRESNQDGIRKKFDKNRCLSKRFSIGRSCCLGRFVTCYVFFLPFFASLLQLRHLPLLFLLVCFPTILRGQSEKLFLLRPRITLLYELFYIFLWLLFWHQRSKSFVIFLSIFHFSALATYTTDCNCYTSS